MAHWAPGNADLPTSGVTPGTYGDGTHVGQVTVAASGLVTAASNVLITGGGGSGNFTLICDDLLSGSQASFDTNTILGGNISGAYKHLKLYVYGRSDNADTNEALYMNFNNDSTAAHYDIASFTFSGGGTTSSTGGTDSKITMGNIPAANAPASYFSQTEVTIANYADTTGFKSTHGLGGLERGTTAANSFVVFNAGLWLSTAAVNRIAVVPQAGNFVAGSRFTLYGLS
jgi:hypothetical protein